jgi:hypothetical protein
VGNPNLSPNPQHQPDPRRNLFWLYISFLGISVPKPGQEAHALRILMIGVALFVLFLAAGLMTIFHLW